MKLEVRWTPEAERTFSANLDYLSENWGQLVVADFISRVDSVLAQIANNPNLYEIYRREDNVHRCVVHERIVLFYRIVDDKIIHLITFWNTYRDLTTLKL